LCAPNGEEYGRDRLLTTAAEAGQTPVEDLPGHILASMERFLGDGEFEDDVCIVSLERGPLQERPGAT
jgi:serine phosphatase RsbU (regulator of sigma subunit)